MKNAVFLFQGHLFSEDSGGDGETAGGVGSFVAVRTHLLAHSVASFEMMPPK